MRESSAYRDFYLYYIRGKNQGKGCLDNTPTAYSKKLLASPVPSAKLSPLAQLSKFNAKNANKESMSILKKIGQKSITNKLKTTNINPLTDTAKYPPDNGNTLPKEKEAHKQNKEIKAVNDIHIENLSIQGNKPKVKQMHEEDIEDSKSFSAKKVPCGVTSKRRTPWIDSPHNKLGMSPLTNTEGAHAKGASNFSAQISKIKQMSKFGNPAENAIKENSKTKNIEEDKEVKCSGYLYEKEDGKNLGRSLYKVIGTHLYSIF
jgi:hypothetical protein